MRPKWHFLVLAVLCCASHRTAAQSQPGPTLLPPPETALPKPVTPDDVLPLPEASAPTNSESILSPDYVVEEEDPIWYQPNYWLDPMPWDSGIELGVNGSSGTSESLSVRTGGYIKRESRFSKLDLSAYHNRTTTGGTATQNNAQFDVRNDWLLDETSPWTLFGTSNVFYDEFQSFDLQTSANTGVGYRFVHEAGTRLDRPRWRRHVARVWGTG